jgi:hypothetical protein
MDECGLTLADAPTVGCKERGEPTSNSLTRQVFRGRKDIYDKLCILFVQLQEKVVLPILRKYGDLKLR